MSDNLIPVSDAQSKAIEESAKAAQLALKILEGMGGYLGQVFGTVPSDLVGILGGDWLKVRRVENLEKILRRSKERLEARGTTPIDPPTLSLTLPLMIAAAEESRDELQDLWARLLAAAVDPNRQHSFRGIFIDVAKKMDPLDAIVLRDLGAKPEYIQSAMDAKARGNENAAELEAKIRFKRDMPGRLKITSDQLSVSLSHLGSLGLVDEPLKSDVHASALGREFLRAIAD